jgi:3-oxoacyl-[acyl-carrier-protein] synthase III
MRIKISSIEKYLPKNRISSEVLDKVVHGVQGRIEKNTGVKFRHHVSAGETVSQMGANALKNALNKNSLKPEDIDLLIFSGASFDYPVPHNSAIIKSKITTDEVNFHCFDIDSTCLSFMNALDVAQLYLKVGRYQRIAIVCSEIASKALSPHDEKVFGLFGDAAVAIILESSSRTGYKQTFANFKNYPSGALQACVPIGGAIDRGIESSVSDKGYYFKMDGSGMIKLVKKHFDGFMNEMKEKTKYSIKDFDAIITHQASRYGNEFFLNNYLPNVSQMVDTLSIYGNCISASIPLGLELLINNNFDTKNKKILILGSGAGLSLGALILEFN